MRNHSYENDFDLHENETACRTHFHMKGFALRLVLKQRHKRTRKWPILSISILPRCWTFPEVAFKSAASGDENVSKSKLLFENEGRPVLGSNCTKGSRV